ncbi:MULTISPECIES: nicotinate-nucleotide--dimethylbenzimidazole phosphoribosyltransferase [Streptomyces]|uniref:Nicotinate-nucleotide--dimethylbenzimidazole phosphoribosyltransferase n=1 Tax=Streptomyces dengpaensis TaxID=2049881 RepID=A0ABN5I9D6_9ACTN|nr:MULTISPECIES: nicotinate-nucleotide--dimethylbenzimidazole phosphoribosyltransferase [Streptomyces]AVH59802.1 nicotinate-nucleotide--dimethylbenzimidazole phosphoribosyltransferase [Streptomyces dengpaensis]PIB09441.1 5,6-dimethylbenzimidazole synthase [Streptomyces sp. HG99]
MTDTGQVPGEGLPENAGMVEQPGVTAPGAYTFLDPSENPAEDDDLLLMPGAQGAWGNEVPPPAPVPFVHEPGPHEPGPHETAGRDSGSVDLGAVRMPSPAPAPQPTPPRRPLHLGPPTPDGSSSPVRSLADRGPAGAPVSPAPVAPAPAAAPVTPVRHAGPPTVGPEYLDVSQFGETPPQGAVPWGAPPVASEAAGAETVVPEAGQTPAPVMAHEVPGAAEAPRGAEAAPVEAAQAGVAEVQPPVHAVQVAEGSFAPQGAPQGPAEAQAPEAVPALDGSLDPRAAHAGQTADATPLPAASAAPEAPATPEFPHALHAADATEFPGHAGGDVHVHVSAHEAAPARIPADGEHFTPAQAAHDAPQQIADPAAVAPAAVDQIAVAPAAYGADGAAAAEPEAQVPAQAHQFGNPGVHIPESAAQFADARSHAEAAPPLAEHAPHVRAPAQAALTVDADASYGGVVPGLEAFPAQQFADPAAFAATDAAEESHGVPVGVTAHAEAPQASVGGSHGEQHFPGAGDAAGASGLPGAPVESHADHSLGQFVPVEGTVPTTPHLAPTPPHAMTVPPLPVEEQPTAEEPAEEAIAMAPAPAEEIVDQNADQITEQLTEQLTEQVTEEPAEEPAERSSETAAQSPAAEAEPIAPPVVPAPREPEAETETPLVPEPPAAAPEPVVAQQADDLDTQGADQEESTAAVEDVRESTGPAAPGYGDAEREAVLRVMRERRDIRNGFRSDPIPHDVLLRVLEAAHTAPSVGHSQPWDFVVIRSAETRRSMHELATRQREAYAKSLPKGRAKQFKELKIEAILDTPVNIVVTADPTRGGRHTLGRHTQPQMAPYSSALAVENLWLAARAEGLGVGWVSFFDEREMVRALGLPEHLEVVAYLCVGYVDEFPDEPELMQAGWSKRRPLSWVVHEETYGRRALPGEEPHDLLAETVSNIRPLDAKALGEAWERQKRMTKPAGALGMLEIISAQLSGLSRMCPPPIPEPAAVAIFAGDHGVHAQGVTPWPQEVTAQMVANFLGGGAVCNAFANQVGAEVCVVDVGVASDLPATPGLLPRKVRAGTADMTTGPALTREDVIAAIEVGIETARDLVAAGNKALLTGEMGIANTTASAALISVFTGTDPSEVTGRGTGINDETLARKTEVVRRAIELHQPDPADPIGVLAAIGGLEHAAMVGLLLGGASLRTPVILDGVSAGAAALVARAIAPEALAACIAGHRSAEPGHVAALNKLGLRPLVDLDLRLGEGTGALLALPVVQSAARAMHEVATFDSAGVTEK